MEALKRVLLTLLLAAGPAYADDDPREWEALNRSLIMRDSVPPEYLAPPKGAKFSPEILVLAPKVEKLQRSPREPWSDFEKEFRKLAAELKITDSERINWALSQYRANPPGGPRTPAERVRDPETGGTATPTEVEARYVQSRLGMKNAESQVGSALARAPNFADRKAPEGSPAEGKGAAPRALGFVGYTVPADYQTNAQRANSLGAHEPPGLGGSRKGYVPLDVTDNQYAVALAKPDSVAALHDTEQGWNKLCDSSLDPFSCRAHMITRFCFKDLGDDRLTALRAKLLEEYNSDCLPKGEAMRNLCNVWKHAKLFTSHGYFPTPGKGICAVDAHLTDSK